MRGEALFTVAIVGPDGSGKSIVSKMLVEALPELRMKRVYMGINLEASNLMLPQTRLLLLIKKARGGRPDMAGPYVASRAKPASKNPLKRALKGLKAWLLLANRLAEEWFRQLIAWFYLWRGWNVLFDRHFWLDFYYHDMQYQDPSKPLPRRVHGYLLKKFYPRPDLVVFLDAPAEVLFSRKGEGTLESLEQYRQDYLRLGETLPAFAVVDSCQPLERVVEQAGEVIREFARTRGQMQKRPAARPFQGSGGKHA